MEEYSWLKTVLAAFGIVIAICVFAIYGFPLMFYLNQNFERWLGLIK